MSLFQKLFRNESGSATMWAVTALVAFAIVGISVFVAVNREPAPQMKPVQEQSVAPTRSQVTPEPQPVPEPQRRASRPAPVEQPVTRRAPKSAPTPEPEPIGPAQLRLDNLAGTLSVILPFDGRIPLDHTCYRRNQSPALRWEGAPPGTQSYVVFLERRTTDDGEPVVNWIVFDIPGNVERLSGKQPRKPVLANGAKHAMSDYSNTGYIGPCEPKGRYRYAVRVFALDTVPGLEPGVGKDDLIRAMNGHIIDAAEQEFTHYYRL